MKKPIVFKSKVVRSKAAKEAVQSYLKAEPIAKEAGKTLSSHRTSVKAALKPFLDDEGNHVSIFMVPLDEGGRAQVTRQTECDQKSKVLDALLDDAGAPPWSKKAWKARA